MQSQIVFGRIDVVSFSVIIHKQCHVPTHLPAFEIPHRKHSALYLGTPFGSPPFHIFSSTPRRFLFRKILRHSACVDTTRLHKPERSRWGVAHSRRATRRTISLPFQLEMEPHHVFSGFLIVNHFRTLYDASAFYIVALFLSGPEGKTFVCPCCKVRRRIDCHPLLRQ
ncbi:hypothetical protein IMSAGC016_01665 [Muribaculaceae bacterium]|nr:hypothetical protein IMSAGC016_01665 [Muribaculaceae bacterium]